MTARLTDATVDFKGAPALAPRRQKSLILAGALIPRGTLAFDHNGRAMPAGPIDITKTIAQGGPLKVAGASVNGDLYFWSPLGRPVSLVIANGAALAISTLTPGVIQITIVSGTTTANQVVTFLRGHAGASAALHVYPGGTGADFAGVATAVTPPRIRMLGVALFGLDNTANATDQLIPVDKSEFAYGRLYMANDTVSPLDDTMVPGVGLVLDNVTITSAAPAGVPLLSVPIDEIGRSGPYTGLVVISI